VTRGAALNETFPMQKLKAADLYSLEQYSRERPAIRTKVMEHKRARQVAVGPNLMWLFEDRITIQYQVQEMLRAERIFESEGIQDELDAYNPLIPDGSNWKVTLLIEFPDENERRVQLTRLKGVEDRCWVQVAGFAKVFAIADEDLERENDEKTSSVHFLRFELSAEMAAAFKAGAALAMGVDHENYRHEINPVAPAVQASLRGDLG
jgi:hypothetical protein